MPNLKLVKINRVKMERDYGSMFTLGPRGPFRQSGVDEVPQLAQWRSARSASCSARATAPLAAPAAAGLLPWKQ
jgi:hypothetical protein